MPEESVPHRVNLDSAQLRCLAHPLRSRLLGALRTEGPATSAHLATRLRTNTGATSYHLRQLAEVGLVAEDEGRGTARERWWRAVHEITSWSETDFESDPDDRAAAEWLLGHGLRLKNRWREDWLEQRHDWSAEWRTAATSSDLLLQLSPGQLSRLKEELLDVVVRYRAAGPDPDGDAERVMVLLDCFPISEGSL